MSQSAEKDRTPHTHGGTDAPECTRYGVQCAPEVDDLDLEPLTDWLEDVLVGYDEQGQLFGTSGAGAYFLAQHLTRALASRVFPPVECPSSCGRNEPCPNPWHDRKPTRPIPPGSGGSA